MATRLEPFQVMRPLVTRPAILRPMVPEVVMVPPVNPLLVAMEVTDPLPVPAQTPLMAKHPEVTL